MNAATRETLMSTGRNEWQTPQAFFERYHLRWHFTLDVAATIHNRMVPNYLGPDHRDRRRRDALTIDWREFAGDGVCWMNPPYSRELQKPFVEKAVAERQRGVTTVALLPARTDTHLFHDLIWDDSRGTWRNNVFGEFIRGRLRFGGATAGAPFPSMVVVFLAERPTGDY